MTPVTAGADLLWRAKEPVANRIVHRLPDGSYRAKFGDGKQALTVRVIEYALPGSNTIYRLLTSLLGPVMAPAHELAALYAERWEIEICYGELKVVQWALPALRSLTVEASTRSSGLTAPSTRSAGGSPTRPPWRPPTEIATASPSAPYKTLSVAAPDWPPGSPCAGSPPPCAPPSTS